MFYANCRIKSEFASQLKTAWEHRHCYSVCVSVCAWLGKHLVCLAQYFLAFFWLLLAGINWFGLYINANICLGSLSLSLFALRWRPPASTGTSLSSHCLSHSAPLPFSIPLFAIGLADCLSPQRIFRCLPLVSMAAENELQTPVIIVANGGAPLCWPDWVASLPLLLPLPLS